jgi:hypothetical protein
LTPVAKVVASSVVLLSIVPVHLADRLTGERDDRGRVAPGAEVVAVP